MAKPPVKAPAKAAPKPSAAKSKSAAKEKTAAAEPPAPLKRTATPEAKPAAKATAAKAVAPSPRSKSAAAKPKSAAAQSGVAKLAHNTADAITKLASDILEDRIVPTIEQIKSVAAHVSDATACGKPKVKRVAKK